MNVNYERFSHIVLVFLLLTLNMSLPTGSSGQCSYHRNQAIELLQCQAKLETWIV